MSKKTIVLAAGSLVLAVAGFLTTSANRRFTGATSAFFKTAGSTIQTLFKGSSTTNNLLTETKITSRTAFFGTTKTTGKTLFGTRSGSTLSKTLFWK